MKTMTLKDLLTQEQSDAVFKIITTAKDDIDLITQLKRYFVQFRDQLESKGVHPEYLAYALPFFLEEQLKRQGEKQATPRVDLN